MSADPRRIGIVGGGVYGLAVAYFLSRFGDVGGDLEVTVFERDSIASGSTGYSAGIVRHHYTNPVQIRVAKRGREILESFDSYVGHDGGFHRNGYVVTADPDGEADFRAIVERQREAGLEVEYVDPAALPEYLPALDPEGVTLAAYEPTAGFADPSLVARGFAEAARENGVEIHTSEEVRDVRRDGATVTAVETSERVLPVDDLVNAAGPWGREVAAMVGVDVPLEWHESKIAVLRADEPYGPHLPTLSDHATHPDMYCKPEPGGDFLVGGIDRPTVDRDTGLEGVGTDYLRQVSQRLERRLPGYADAEVIESWSGIITVTPDAHQIAGVPEGLTNVYQIVGGSGHGFKEAPAFGESIAQTLLGLEPTVDLAPYRLERFADDEPLVGVSTTSYTDEA
jgi:sarcosine oxidase subunit beta